MEQTITWWQNLALILGALGGFRALARFKNKNPDEYGGNNYGILVDIDEPTYGRAYAMTAKGAITSNSFIADYGFTDRTPKANTTTIPADATKPNPFRILAHFVNSNAGLSFPTRDSVCGFLDISPGSRFAVKFTVIAAANSTQTGWIRGRNTAVSGMNTNQYPYLLNNNGGQETGKLGMARGDVAEFLLVYDGSNYYAYTLNYRS